MKIIEQIETLNLQLDDEECQNLSKKLKKKYSILGNILFYLGVILAISLLILTIVISIYAIINKVIIYWHFFLIIGILIFSILAIIGKVFKSISKLIVINEKNQQS